MVNVYLSPECSRKKGLVRRLKVGIVENIADADITIIGDETPLPRHTKMKIIDLGSQERGGNVDQLFHLRPDDDDSIIDLLILLKGVIEYQDNDIKDALKFERSLQKGATRFISNENFSEDFLKKYYDLIILANESSRYESIDNLILKANAILQDDTELISIRYTKNKESDDVVVLSENDFLEITLKEMTDRLCFLGCLLVDIVDNYHRRELHLKTEVNLWEAAFNLVSPPSAVISTSGELLLHNPKFMKLKAVPTRCLEFTNGERIEIDNTVYRIEKIDLDNSKTRRYLFMFIDELQSTTVKNISTQELGIISSSVAHELKNPLAGIIAAVSVLQLEENFDRDTMTSFEEMKRGGQRCKDLVEIFLGFSRKDLEGRGSSAFNEAVEQALNLLRFRMVEKNVRLDVIQEENVDSLIREVNISVVSMIFYLILSEIITDFAHFSLLSGGEKVLRAKLMQKSNFMSLTFDSGNSFEFKRPNSKLVDHLLTMENLELEIQSGTIILRVYDV